MDAPLDAKVCSEEAFAPLVVLARFSDFEAAVSQADDSRFGLQAGVFTNDLGDAFRAFDGLEVGGVILNDIPTYRIDHMPYGRVKDSGHGREGLRYAIEDMQRSGSSWSPSRESGAAPGSVPRRAGSTTFQRRAIPAARGAPHRPPR